MIKLYIVKEDKREGGNILLVTHRKYDAYDFAAKFIKDHNDEDYVQSLIEGTNKPPKIE